jgi:hypothetical protein
MSKKITKKKRRASAEHQVPDAKSESQKLDGGYGWVILLSAFVNTFFFVVQLTKTKHFENNATHCFV